MSYQEIACLVLKTNVLPTNGTTNAYGTSNAMNTSFTWTNINLRTLLGGLFDKYDRFMLLLQHISNSPPTANIGTAADDRAVLINMSGLSFLNSNYNQKFQSNTGSIIVCPYLFSSGGAACILYNNFAISSFSKQNDVVNININYTKTSTELAPTTNFAFGHVAFFFNIVGIEEYRVKDVMNNRLLK